MSRPLAAVLTLALATFLAAIAATSALAASSAKTARSAFPFAGPDFFLLAAVVIALVAVGLALAGLTRLAALVRSPV